MKLETLKDRIQNAETKVEKKTATIAKKQTLLAKKQDKVRKLGVDPDTFDKYQWRTLGEEKGNEVYWLMCDIEHLGEDIERNKKEIPEIQKAIENYKKQVAGEMEKESILLKEIPESMKRMQTELVAKWDEWDMARRNKINEDHIKLEYREWCKKYTFPEREMIYKTDEQIHSENVSDAKFFILQLYYRVKDITGDVTDWSYIELEDGTGFFPTLNGVVVGKMGKATVHSIYAGGWNIQRLHVRVLVKEWK